MKAGGSGLTMTAIVASALLHGALAATALLWPTDPVPAPTGGAVAVELVVLAPSTPDSPMAPAPPAAPSPNPAPAPAPSASSVSAPAPAPEPATPPVRPITAAQMAAPVPLAPASGPETPAPPEPAIETAALPEPAADTPVPPEAVAEPADPAPPEPAEQTARPAPVVFDFVPAPHRPTPPPRPKAALVRAAAPPPPTEATEIAEASSADRSAATGTAPAAANPVATPAAAPTAPPATAETETAALPPNAERPDAAGPAGGTGVDIGPRFTVGSPGNPLPRYPLMARRRGLEGRVVLRVRVGPEGSVRAVAVAESSRHAVLDEAAVAALKHWRFEPARRAGIPVAAAVDVPITFRLRD